MSGSSDSSPPVFQGQPLSKVDTYLEQGFAEEVVEQSRRLDELAKQLITLELAIPGIYAAVMKLAHGGKAVAIMPSLFITFIFWALALGLTLASLVPVKYKVDSNMLEGEIDGSDIISIRAYFKLSSKRKRNLLIPACILTFIGTCFAVFNALS
jgi:hypothetical protein